MEASQIRNVSKLLGSVETRFIKTKKNCEIKCEYQPRNAIEGLVNVESGESHAASAPAKRGNQTSKKSCVVAGLKAFEILFR